MDHRRPQTRHPLPRLSLSGQWFSLLPWVFINVSSIFFFYFLLLKYAIHFFLLLYYFLIIHELLIFRMRMNVNERALDLNVDVNDSKIHHKELCNIITLIIYMYWLVFQKNPPTTILLKLLLFLPKKKKWKMLVCEW